MRRSTGSYLRLLPATIWVFIQLWMSATLAHAIPATGAASDGVTLIPCGGTTPITISFGPDTPDAPHGAAAHARDWCQSFGVSTQPAPAGIPGRAALFNDAHLKSPGAVDSHYQVAPCGYLSRAPPV